MTRGKNKILKGFLKTYRKGKPGEVKYIPLRLGFLKLEYGLYDEPEVLSLVSFVLNDNDEAIAIGLRLEMMLGEVEGSGEVTYISENGVSGFQWSDGYVIWGHTFNDDSSPERGKKIGLDQWIDDCIAEMINPSEEELAERQKLDEKDSS